MNQFFSFNRFGLLISKHWEDNKKRYGLSVVACIGLLIVWFTFTLLGSSPDEMMSADVQYITYFLFLFVFGTFHASLYFQELGSKAKGSYFLLVPASAFEKVLCGLLFTVLLFFAVFTAAFYAVDLLMLTISKSIYANDEPGGKSLVNVFDVTVFHFSNNSPVNFLLLFFSIQSVFLLGSVYFAKYSFIKTFISGFVFCFLIFCLIYFLYRPLFPAGKSPNLLVQIPDWIGMLFHIMITFVMAPLLWIATYYRLKVKQL